MCDVLQAFHPGADRGAPNRCTGTVDQTGAPARWANRRTNAVHHGALVGAPLRCTTAVPDAGVSPGTCSLTRWGRHRLLPTPGPARHRARTAGGSHPTRRELRRDCSG
ncbi:hypothetical protein GCM10009533_63930 [Saccharopolyspora spinosporotrichia]|uniref:Uncharacterized protein n=1 Tax=Saccharopolyspora erythraea TaxID=1836 RepID=A0ABN1E2Y1_SACER